MHWYNEATIKSYDDARALFKTARKPDDGKPIRSWARLHRDNGVFDVRQGEVVIARITSDNILTFPLTVHKGRSISNTLSSSLHRVIPFMWSRLGKGRYAIEHTGVLDNHIASQPARFYWGGYMREKSPELFSGLQFNLLTGECLNARPKPNSTHVKHDTKTIWLRALRQFKHGIHLRAKMGVLETLCQQVAAERSVDRNNWHEPDWTHERWTELLYTSIKNNEFPTELLRGLVMSSKVSYWGREVPNTRTTLDAVDIVCDDLSVELRTRFGVFGA